MGLGFRGLGFRGLGFGGSQGFRGLGFRGLGFRVWGLQFGVQDWEDYETADKKLTCSVNPEDENVKSRS